ncbi:hypothetical protein F8O01_08105 [Pseudoclavibacter chungangensis]|uniref:Uncharacterized protein n=1 Tax=Pseudoclavibacter chungangensis TaxID=587635 RepID=A0A7J5BSK1_9MICO|nr:hypothetical protein [Pseudoclavibacter chungangensis]KAB1653424.1 hypothetical protein F8O01_15240 [Pseudoclavibacter chungangensis]KAB1657212.1 hypothetical protein F8O01_08105 [Pseudoclavibacter chungangensis]NYJ66358.1 hypothetical protein [Pseudoclavibacter chungangensis]
MEPEGLAGRQRHLLLELIGYEIRMQNAIAASGLSSTQVVELAVPVLAIVERAAEYRWRRPGVHVWEEDGATIARCGTCLLESPPLASRQAAGPWFGEHRTLHADAAPVLGAQGADPVPSADRPRSAPSDRIRHVHEGVQADDTGERRALDRLEASVRTAIDEGNTGHGLGLTASEIETMAWAIMVEIDHAFALRWRHAEGRA